VNAVERIDIPEHIRSLLAFDKNGKCTNAFKIITRPQTLLFAYEMIKSNSGNMVEGSDNTTLDGIDWN